MLLLDVGVEKNALVYSEEGGFEVSHNHALGGLIRTLEVSLIRLIVEPQKPVLDNVCRVPEYCCFQGLFRWK